MESILEKLKAGLRKIKPLYRWYCNKRTNKERELLQQNGFNICKRINEILEDSGIEYFYNFGTLLGLIRDNGFIKHDVDLDLGVMKTEDFSWDKLSDLLTKCGLTKLHEFTLNGEITEQTYTFNGTNIDFFLNEYEGDKMVSYSYFNKTDNDKNYKYNNEFERSVNKNITCKITEFKYINVNGINFRIPKNAEEYLEDNYGKSWRVPDPNWVTENAPAWNELDGICGIYVPSDKQ